MKEENRVAIMCQLCCPVQIRHISLSLLLIFYLQFSNFNCPFSGAQVAFLSRLSVFKQIGENLLHLLRTVGEGVQFLH